ncbi:MAG: MFS transporter [Xanthomonadaceae bacterium]|nr:MFS transporter [Xanthomonadaceae bacterium]
MTAKQNNYPPARLAWSMWGLGAALYLIGFYQRVAPAVMTGELMKDFAIGAAGLGNLSAFYFYSYVAMQTPTGILADRLGPRRLLSMGALVAGIGGLIFGLAPTMAWAGLGRLLIGGSVAVAFVGMLKLASHWFAPRQFALASGMALFCGIIGAVFAGVPLRLLVNTVGWRPVMTVSALITLVVAVAIWLFVRDDPAEKGYQSYNPTIAGKSSQYSIITGIKKIFRYRNTWLLCLIPGGVVGCILTFSGLWGVPFLTTHYGLLPAKAAALNSAMLVAWAVGGPLCGGLSDRIGLRKPLYVVCNIALVGAWSVIIFVPSLPLPLLTGLLLFAGLASGGMIISFAFIKESVPADLGGTASGILNMGVMAGPMILQPAVGLILDLKWHGDIVNGVKVYSFSAYRCGFSLMLAWAVLSAVLILFTKETYCQQST